MVRRFGQPASGGSGGDPYWANVVSLLNFDGADGSTTFTDEKGKTWTANGNAQIDTSQGYPAGQFDGNDFISTPSHADFDFGSGLYTVELWINPASVSGFQNLWRKSAGADWAPLSIALDGNKLRCRSSENGSSWRFDATGTISISTGVLTHIAACRDAGGYFRMYCGGLNAMPGTALYTGSVVPNSAGVCIGALSDANAGYSGLVRAARVTKGVCRYPGGTAFTPPSAPFPNG